MHSIKFDVKSLALGWYSEPEILKTSVLEITLPASFDMFGHPVPDGLYDLRMGPLNTEQSCQTCKLDYFTCPGHFGHYRLSRPVLNPLTFDMAYALFRSCCCNCFHFKITAGERLAFYTRLEVYKRGLEIPRIEAFTAGKTVQMIQEELARLQSEPSGYEDSQAFEFIAQFIRKNTTKTSCPRCHFKGPKFTKSTGLKIFRMGQSGMSDLVNAAYVRETLQKLFENEQVLVAEMFNTDKTEMFFLTVLPVMANKLRPASYVANKVSECHLNSILAKIIHSSVMTESDEGAWASLQEAVLYYFDSSKNSPDAYAGHKQIIEKKQGLFRNNILGKRVNYAARSVISPDPTLHTSEVGIPLVFATQLTFPERVTSFNFDRLRRMVMNGAQYPGANFVHEDGALVNLKYISHGRRTAIANRLMDGKKTVWRHVQDGDHLLVNRQPTLHSVSLMGHQAKVLKNEKTLRLHYVNCKSYNADFDGDEMNIHFPQDYNSASEVQNIVHNDNSYFTPSSGDPIRGLTQDHVIAAASLTMKDSFFTCEEFQSLVCSAISNLGRETLPRARQVLLPLPCIECPVPLYSGKQVVTAILQNFNISINFSVKCKMPFAGEEGVFRVERGVVITGVLDKASIGASPFSLIHACGELYGYAVCNDLLTIFSRMVNRFIAMKGFTVRYDDLLLDPQMDLDRRELFRHGSDQAVAYQDWAVAEDFYFDEEKTTVLDKKMRSFMNNVTSQVVQRFEGGLLKKFPTNNMANIILSGSKGSMVNLGQIAAALGQQELEGRRVPYMKSGKTLPCFRRLERCPSAGGFVFERFLTGVNPATYFFHSMAGREGLIDTAIKTANSGYLQRCLAKHLEGVFVHSDGRVEHNGRVIQFKYGDDGYDITKSSYLNGQDIRRNNSEIAGTARLEGTDACRVDPGKAVGMIAAQSVGEPSTQMTLNTFHLAGVGGRNVTLGIPRLREILMVASKKLKTPVITVPIKDEKIAGSFMRVSLRDCLKRITVEEKMKERDKEYKKRIRIVFEIVAGEERAIEVIDKEFLRFVGKELKKRSAPTGITEYREETRVETRVVAESSEEDDEESSGKEDTESSEEEDFLDERTSTEINDENTVVGSEIDNGEINNEIMTGDDRELLNIRRAGPNTFMLDIFYPPDFNVLLLPIIEGLVDKVTVWEVKGFTRATVTDGLLYLEGSDFQSLTQVVNGIDLFTELDFYNSLSNDIYAIYKTFGIEAARATIVREIDGVFDAYGIKVNIRHLYLIADYMTKDGSYKAFSRHSFTMDDCFMEKMGFESCFMNLRNSAIYNQKKAIETPTACLMTGSLMKSGTGSFDLFYDIGSVK